MMYYLKVFFMYNDEMISALKESLSKCMVENNYTIARISRELKIGRPTMYSFLTGKRKASILTMAKVYEFLKKYRTEKELELLSHVKQDIERHMEDINELR